MLRRDFNRREEEAGAGIDATGGGICRVRVSGHVACVDEVPGTYKDVVNAAEDAVDLGVTVTVVPTTLNTPLLSGRRVQIQPILPTQSPKSLTAILGGAARHTSGP